jgi:hypothetical protein
VADDPRSCKDGPALGASVGVGPDPGASVVSAAGAVPPVGLAVGAGVGSGVAVDGTAEAVGALEPVGAAVLGTMLGAGVSTLVTTGAPLLGSVPMLELICKNLISSLLNSRARSTYSS